MTNQPILTPRLLSHSAPWGWLARLMTRVRALMLNRTARKGLFALVDQALVSGISFVTTVVVGRTCGKETLGGYILAMSVLLFCKGIQDQLIAAPYVIYSGRKTNLEADRYAGSVLVHQLILALSAMMFLAATGWLTGGELGGSQLPAVFYILAAVTPLYLVREYVRSYSFAHLRMATAIAFDALIAVLQLGCLGVCVAWGMLGEQTALMAGGFAWGIAACGWFVWKQQRYDISPAAIVTDWKQNWGFGRWALASQLLVTAMAYLLPWILTWTHGAEETGTLGASNALTGIANLFVIGLSNLFCPLAAKAFASGGKGELVRSLKTAAVTFLALLGPLTLLQFLAGDLVTTLLFGGNFVGCGMVVTLLMAGLLINSLGIVAGNGLWALERPQANFIADITALGIGLLATLLLVPSYGSLGAAGATLIGHAAGAAVRFVTLRRLLAETPATLSVS